MLSYLLQAHRRITRGGHMRLVNRTHSQVVFFTRYRLFVVVYNYLFAIVSHLPCYLFKGLLSDGVFWGYFRLPRLVYRVFCEVFILIV